jgi:hypothetical protein
MQRRMRLDVAYTKVDADAVNAALKKYLLPQRLVEITAGSFQ